MSSMLSMLSVWSMLSVLSISLLVVALTPSLLLRIFPHPLAAFAPSPFGEGEYVACYAMNAGLLGKFREIFKVLDKGKDEGRGMKDE